MYLIDTNVISEKRKGTKANPGVNRFFNKTLQGEEQIYISVISIGELRRGVELIRHRGDSDQAELLESWLQKVIDEYSEYILDFGYDEAQIWGKLRAPHHENPLDKQIAATALVYDLILVTRNISDLKSTGVKLLNPFE